MPAHSVARRVARPSPSAGAEGLAAAGWLAASSAAPGGDRPALRWLETLGAPRIAAGEAGRSNAVVNFVPTNYTGKSGSPHPEQRGKQPRTFPAQSPSSPVVHFVWPEAEADEATKKTLGSLLERVPALGRACSLVRMRLSEGGEEPSYQPDPDGQEVLRVFGEGRLEELETLYGMGRRPRRDPRCGMGGSGTKRGYRKVHSAKCLC